ncbi:SU10 major capsid protein [Aneurinibacillus aneurinilyticus]|uniref:SU10 major capsid protein n=1 Tax=Aneurinibacillus aneurinilyticus TaxID=1391 RepID=UPI0023F1F044|nr:DUF5309 family protein [Aneurinibacillus aneurinilyticus]
MLYTYDFKDQVRQLDAGISLIINDQPTLLGLVGMSGEALTQTKYEWMSDNLNSNRANVKTAVADATSTDIEVITGDGEKFRINAIVVAGEEYMKVTAVNGDTITVVRGFDGTPANASIDAGAELRIVARPQVQGAGVGQDEGHDRYTQFNHTQIIERYASVTGTQLAVNTYNVTNELQYQVELRMKELSRELNDWLIYGRRIAGTKGTPSMTGGLQYFASIEDSFKKNLSGTEISAKVVNDALEELYKRGGSANTILCNTAAARQFSKLAGPTIQTQRADTTTGHRIETFVSDMIGGNIVTLVVDVNMPKDKVIIFDRNIISMHPLQGRGLYDVDASIAGADFVARQIRGEYGVKVKNAKEKIAVLEGVAPTIS